MHPLVSILIPVYNRRQYIGECIESALGQTYGNIEIVVVDNDSTDGTWAICQRYAAADSRVRIFRNETNLGPVRNWMCCARNARGEYSKILFSDDLLQPNCVERMLAAFSGPDVGFVFSAARVGKSPENSATLYSAPGKSSFTRREYLDLLLSGRAPASPGALLIRTEDLRKNLHDHIPTATQRPFNRHGAGPDVMIALLTALDYQQVMHISDPLVFFRVHADSFTVSNRENEVREGYVSAFAYHLRHKEGWRPWIGYIASEWLSAIREAKRWVSPRGFLKAYEGTGSLGELCMGSLVVLWLVARKAFSAMVNFPFRK